MPTHWCTIFRRTRLLVRHVRSCWNESLGTIASTAALASQQYGLLSGDAMIVAIMQDYGLTNLASHDDDFDRVPWLARYAPV